MCRLEGCRKPARVSGPAPSKYCSDEHGREFMRQRVLQKSHRGDKQPAKKKRHVEAEQAAGTLQSTAEAEGAHQAYLRGGLLDPGELKALTDGVKDTAEFKHLGESVLPMNGTDDRPTDNGTHHDHGPEISEANDDTCLPEEKQHLETVLAKAATVRHQLSALRDKELFLGLVKARATQFAAEAVKAAGDSKKKDAGKDICRFDSRLSWSDVEFDEWRHSPEGRSALDTGNLGQLAGAATDAVDGDGDAVMQDVVGEDRGQGVCPKRRCERHKAWYKLHQQEIAYDRRECEDQLAKLGAEARGIEERAIMWKLEGTGDAVNGA
jgi:COMPASS component SPP1